MMSESKKIMKDDKSGDYNLTVDLAYEVIIKENPNLIYNIVKNVPMIKRVSDNTVDERHCRMSFHGRFNKETGACAYYVEARKICLVIDQDDPALGLDADYENFRCNYLNHD